MAVMSIYGKTLKTFLLQNQESFEAWILVYSIGDSTSTIFLSNDDLRWTFALFYGKVKFAYLCICKGEILKNLFLKMYKRQMAGTYNVWST